MPPYIGVLVFSSNKEIVHYFCKHKSITEEDFHQQLEIFRSKVKIFTIALLMDNIAFHKSKATNDLLRTKLNILPLRLVSYSSEYKSAEFIFKLAKYELRKELLIKLQNYDLNKINGLKLVDNIFKNLIIPSSFPSHCRKKQLKLLDHA